MKEPLTTREIKRQEAIYELSRGEQDLIEDLKLARKAYHDPMLKLSIMSEEELTHIFGDLDAYIPLHEGQLCSSLPFVSEQPFKLTMMSHSPLLSSQCVTALSLLLCPSDLLARIGEATKPDGTVEQIGHILVNWVREQ